VNGSIAIEFVAGPTEINGSNASAAPADKAKKLRNEHARHAARAADLTMPRLPPLLTKTMVRAALRECR
jgi:hypothetical protein